MITQEYLKSVLKYDQLSGMFIWLIGKAKGQIAGSYDTKGYCIIKIKKRLYFAHRLAWLYVYDRWPIGEIDHIDGIRDNNKIENLREATRLENVHNSEIGKNNTSGYKGVHWHKRKQKWVATMRVGGKKVHLGMFNDPELAFAAYCNAAEIVQGDFSRLDNIKRGGPKTPFRG